MSNQLTSLARELLEIESDFPFRLDYADRGKATVDDFELHMFMQTWGSTALGFGGIGGQAITKAMTYVFTPLVENQKCIIYFGGRFAYKADYCDALVDDLRKGQVEPVYRAGKYKFQSARDGDKPTEKQRKNLNEEAISCEEVIE